jgi:hypothetical protein
MKSEFNAKNKIAAIGQLAVRQLKYGFYIATRGSKKYKSRQENYTNYKDT